MIQHVHRRGAVYWWRRRLPFVGINGGGAAIEVSLRTRCPQAARRIAPAVTMASEWLRTSAGTGMLTRDEARRFLASVAERHSEKLDAVAAAELAEGRSAAEGKSTDRAMAWATRILAARGPLARPEKEFTEQMLQDGLDEDQVIEVWQLVAEHLEGMTGTNAKVERLMREQGIAPSPTNLAQARQLYFRGLSAALGDVRRRWDGERPEDRLVLDEALTAGTPTPEPRLYWSPQPEPTAPAWDKNPAPCSVDLCETRAPVAKTAGTLERQIANEPATDPTVARQETSEAKAANRSLKALAERMAKENLKLGTWQPNTADQARAVIDLYVRMLGEDDVSLVTQSSLAEYRSLLLRLPKNYGKSVHDKVRPLHEILARAEGLPPSEVGVSGITLNRHLSQLQSVLEYARSQGLLKVELEGVAKLRAKRSKRQRDERSAFSDDDLKSVFRQPVWHGCEGDKARLKPGSLVIQDALYWVPLIAAYSGARREEICGLMVDDIGAEGSTPYLSIRKNKYRGLKNAQSERRIPLASELVRLGLPEYVRRIKAEGYDLLFPELVAASDKTPLGDVFHDRWSAVQKAAVPNASAEAKTFHSFRHWIGDRLKSAGVSAEMRADILGHAGTTMTTERYVSSPELGPMLEALDRLPRLTADIQPAGIVLLGAVQEHRKPLRRRRARPSLSDGRRVTRRGWSR